MVLVKMIKLEKITEKMRTDILDFLYQNEMLNIFMIHYFEHKLDELGTVYIGEEHGSIRCIVHMKDDGNSHFTSYYALDNHDLTAIAQFLNGIELEDILIAGKVDEVQYILDKMDIKKTPYLNSFYKFNENYKREEKWNEAISLRRANNTEEDIDIIKKYKISFFQADTESAIERITNEQKIRDEIENGIYLLEVSNEARGMARFYGQSQNYIDITTLYIDEDFRGMGYGKVLTALMIETALHDKKIPVLQASKDNVVARKLYEHLGFEVICDYTFQFI